MNDDFFEALKELEKEKGISVNILQEAIEAALLSAYKRNFGSTQNARVCVDRNTGAYKVYTQRVVVKKVVDPRTEISIEEAHRINPCYEAGDIIEGEVTPRNFGRIAAQTAKQVVVQRIREAERSVIYEEFANREGDIVTGIVQRIEQKNVYIELGKAEAMLALSEQMPGEDYRYGKRIKVYIVEVKKSTKGPQILVSRTHPGLLKRLFELEVPELVEGIIELQSIAREAGARSKIAVYSKTEDIDPVGACVGPRGMRVQAIVNELNGEKIDIIRWDPDASKFIASSLSPAKVITVEIWEEEKIARVIVPDNQLSLAIGKDGQNARLAAKLTGWKIDIKNKTIYDEEQEKSRVMDELIGGLVERLSPLTVIAVEVQEKQKNLLFTITFEDYLEALEKTKDILPGEPCQDWTLTVQPPLIGPDGEFQMADVAELLMKLLHPVEIVSLKLNKKDRKLLLSIYEKDLSEVRKKQEENISLSKLGEWNIVLDPLVEEGLDESLIPVLLEAISPVNVISLEIEEKEKMIIIFVPQEETGEAEEKLEKVQLPASLSDWKIDIKPFNVEQK